MNKIVIQKLSLWFSIALLTVSCSGTVQTNEQDKEKLKQDEIDTKVAQIIEKRDFLTDFKSFTEQTQLKVEKNNQSITELRQVIIEERKSSNGEFATKIRQLDFRNKALQKKIAAFDQSHLSEWRNFKSEVNRDFDELESAINNLFTISKSYQ
ncbi:hypothetical protein MM239_19725 [Belliella sp. DSM 111904]|uniref:Uncharacterized protein n=1 Tax=Belliella filtrata TaxID=2923435 RepID=A0ABS9V6P9_9BACT|nr:hypothetical protein [Belliella filtrata]MCH7411625.1 hypothetical protein [Belliella filtrata]